MAPPTSHSLRPPAYPTPCEVGPLELTHLWGDVWAQAIVGRHGWSPEETSGACPDLQQFLRPGFNQLLWFMWQKGHCWSFHFFSRKNKTCHFSRLVGTIGLVPLLFLVCHSLLQWHTICCHVGNWSILKNRVLQSANTIQEHCSVGMWIRELMCLGRLCFLCYLHLLLLGVFVLKKSPVKVSSE